MDSATISVIPQQYQLNKNGDNFLFFNNGLGDLERVIIFSFERQMELLANSDQWFADRPFKLWPKVFF